MQETTDRWLTPMIKAAQQDGIDIPAIMASACIPAQEAGGDAEILHRQFAGEFPDAQAAGVKFGAIDWITFGRLLRQELGWESTYPEYPPQV